MSMLFNKLSSISKTFLLSVIILAITALAYNISALLINASSQAIKTNDPVIKSQFSYLIDKNTLFSVEDIAKRQNTFIDVKANNIPYELGSDTYWVRIQINNTSSNNEAIVIHADNAKLDLLKIYRLNGDNAFDLAFSSLNKNTMTEKIFPHLAVNLKAESQTTVLFKISTLGPPSVPLILYRKNSFNNRVQLTQMMFGAFIGIILLMSAYNIVLYFAIKDKVYIVYVGYLLASFIVLSSVNGFGYFLFSEDTQDFINNNYIFFHYLLIIFLLLFTLFFLRYDESKNKSYLFGIIFCCFLFVTSFVSATLEPILQAKLFFSLQPLMFLFALAIIFRRIKKDFTWAKFYFISWIPLISSAVIQPLVLLNYLEYSFLARNAFLFGVLIEITFMSFALAERMRRNEVDSLMDVLYHKATKLPRKITLENAINTLIEQKVKKFSVLVIKPEQIEQIALYMNDVINITLFERLNNYLTPLFAYNDAVIELGSNQEKLCFLENHSLGLLINHKDNHQPITVIIQSIQDIISEHYQIDTLKLPLSGIIGVSNYPEHGQSSQILINRAQIALHHAEISHHKWEYFESTSSDKANYLLKLASDMKNALTNQEFEIYHQPQIDLKTLRVCGSECLIRWKHKNEGFIAPSVFIPVAEDIGLINELTLWVVKQALEQHHSIIENGHSNHMVSINISGKDLASKRFYDDVLENINKSNIPPEKIIFELTESATITDSKHALAVINKLNELGITISIDDFGTGYSSMSYICELPFQELKVDKQFVENVCDSIKRRTIAETTVKMAKGLGLEVVAEGINSQLDEDTLRDFGCDIGQGYYYAEPMPIMSYLIWLNEQVNGHKHKDVVHGVFIPADKKNKAFK